jgi:nicotinamide riboside transporter PnuC
MANPTDSTSRNIEWGPWIVVASGLLLFLLGTARFILRRQFGFMDALHCALTIVAAGFLLLVFDYVLHHAKLVVVIPLFAAGVLVYSSPVFDVALGLTLMGAMAGPALSDWKDAQRLRTSGAPNEGENNEVK